VDGDLERLFFEQTPLLDVRAPVEFAKGAFPGASNFPLLDDLQREQVGTRYREAGQAAAIALGHELLSPDIKEKRIATWTEFVVNNPNAALYCFRGGLRSQTVEQWLAESGVRLPRIAGGYKRMRQFLLDQIAYCAEHLPLLVLAGRTGTGKTRLLLQLPFYIDLEGLAKHRGSSFGRLLEDQPTTVDFENTLAVELLHYRRAWEDRGTNEPAKPSVNVRAANVQAMTPLVVEDEGRLIGRIALPAELKERMSLAPAIRLEAPLSERIEVVKADYIQDLSERYCQHQKVIMAARSDVSADSSSSAEAIRNTGLDTFADYHRAALARIHKRLGGERTQTVLQLFERAFVEHKAGKGMELYHDYIEFLLHQYYDPMYDYQMANKKRDILFSGSAHEILQWFEAGGFNKTFADRSEQSAFPVI